MNIYFGIYLIIGVAVLLIHRFTKDSFDRKPLFPFLFMPELVLLIVLIWPVYLIDFALRISKAKKDKKISCIEET